MEKLVSSFIIKTSFPSQPTDRQVVSAERSIDPCGTYEYTGSGSVTKRRRILIPTSAIGDDEKGL
jgi:hypothetical protein